MGCGGAGSETAVDDRVGGGGGAKADVTGRGDRRRNHKWRRS